MSRGPKDVVAAGYDAIAERYAAWQSEVVGDPREAYVRKLLDRLPGTPDILEIGCGGGVEPTPTFARLGRLIAVDLSRTQIERARAAIPEAELVHADITAMEFAAGGFDAVVALYVFAHVPGAELPGLLQHVARWLRPGGVLLATFGSRAAGDAIVDDWLGAPMFFSGHEQATNERLVREAALTIIESRLEPIEEPASEPGSRTQPVTFHWMLAQKPRR